VQLKSFLLQFFLQVRPLRAPSKFPRIPNRSN